MRKDPETYRIVAGGEERLCHGEWLPWTLDHFYPMRNTLNTRCKSCAKREAMRWQTAHQHEINARRCRRRAAMRAEQGWTIKPGTRRSAPPIPSIAELLTGAWK